MSRTVVTKRIRAAPAVVFQTVADIRQFSRAIPHIVKVEFLSESKVGVGTRFRETRLMRGKEMATELVVTEYEPNDRVRLVADSHGTVWDTVFAVTTDGDVSVVTMTMDARSRSPFKKLMVRLIGGMVKKAIEKDLEAVKAYCEGGAPAP